MDSDPFYTEKEAAKKIFAKPETLNKWRARGKGPVFHKLCGKIRYRLSDLELFISQARTDPTKKKTRRRRVTK